MLIETEKPLVSVLMTAYNREKYIAAAIQSVLSSTYINFELIIVDDSSKDNTVNIAKEYSEKDCRIKIYINEKNLGDYTNRNKSASYAKGKYLKYIDADDYIYPWGLELLVNMMEKFPNAGWGLCSLSQDIKQPFPFILNPEEIYAYNYFTQTIFYKAPLSSIIKNNVFKEVGGFSGKQHLGDFELWHLLALKYPVVLMQQGVVWYREHGDQQMNDNRKNPEIPFKYSISELNFLKKCQEVPLSPKQKSIVIKRTEKQINFFILNKILKGKWKLALQLNRMRSDKNLTLGNY